MEVTGGEIRYWLVNGREQIEIPPVAYDSDELVLRMDHYDSIIRARPGKEAHLLEGEWIKRPGTDKEVRILACPRSRAIADALGYSSIEVRIDPKREIVQRAHYQGLGGGELKRYVLLESLKVDGGLLPVQVRLEHSVNGFDNLIHYEYWPQPEGIPSKEFSQDVSQRSFLSRLRKFVHERGLGERLEVEIEAANARIRAYEERTR